MPTKTFFRILIVAAFVLSIIGAIVSVATQSMLPEPLRGYVEAESNRDMTGRDWVLIAIGIPLLIAALVASIGLFVFWRPARILYLLTGIAGTVLIPFLGPYVESGWGYPFEWMGMIIYGMILALIYFSPIKTFFEKPKIDHKTTSEQS